MGNYYFWKILPINGSKKDNEKFHIFSIKTFDIINVLPSAALSVPFIHLNSGSHDTFIQEKDSNIGSENYHFY